MGILDIAHYSFIQGTVKNTFVVESTLFLCTVQAPLYRSLHNKKILCTTKALKHLYDKRAAWEYTFLLNFLEIVLAKPDIVKANGLGRRGQYIFCKNVREILIAVSIEKTAEKETLYLVTAFATEEKYLHKFPILWSRRDGDPSS